MAEVGNIHSIGTLGLRSSSTAIGNVTSVSTFGWWVDDTDGVITAELVNLMSSITTGANLQSSLGDSDFNASSSIETSVNFLSRIK